MFNKKFIEDNKQTLHKLVKFLNLIPTEKSTSKLIAPQVMSRIKRAGILTKKQTPFKESKFNKYVIWLFKRWARKSKPIFVSDLGGACFNGATLRVTKIVPLSFPKETTLVKAAAIQANACTGCMGRLAPCELLKRATLIVEQQNPDNAKSVKLPKTFKIRTNINIEATFSAIYKKVFNF